MEQISDWREEKARRRAGTGAKAAKSAVAVLLLEAEWYRAAVMRRMSILV